MAQTTNSDSADFNPFICFFALAILCALTLFVRLGYLPMLGPDEPRYAEIAREMYVNKNWITPNLAGVHWFEKPALTYWLSALGYTFFGVSEFSARFFIALFSTGGIFALFFFGQKLRSTRFGYLAAATLATSAIWVGFSRAATFDLPLSVAIEISLLSFYLWFTTQKNSYFYACCFGMGLAMLGKGLIGIVLPGAIIGLFLLLTKNLWSLLQRPKLLLLGALIFLLTSATWYVPMLLNHGHEFVQEFFIEHHFQRFLTNKYQHPQPAYFFTLVTIAGCLPYSLFLLAQVATNIKHWRTLLFAKEQQLTLFLWLWVAVIVGFFSISTSKLTGYILPVFPAVALLLGQQFEQWWQRKPRTLWRWLWLLTIAPFPVLALWMAARADKILYADPLMTMVLAAVIFVTAGAALSLLILRGERLTTLVWPFGVALMLAAVTFSLMHVVSISQSTRRIVLEAKQAARPNERLVFFINNHKSIDFYAPELPLRREHAELLTLMKPAEVKALMEQQPTKSLLVMTPRRWESGLTEIMASEEIWWHHTWVLYRFTPRQ